MQQRVSIPGNSIRSLSLALQMAHSFQIDGSLSWPMFVCSLTLISASSCLALFGSITNMYSTTTICSISTRVFWVTRSTTWNRWISSWMFSRVWRRSPTVVHRSFQRLSIEAISSSTTDKSSVTSLSLQMSVWCVDDSTNVWWSGLCTRISCWRVCWEQKPN